MHSSSTRGGATLPDPADADDPLSRSERRAQITWIEVHLLGQLFGAAIDCLLLDGRTLAAAALLRLGLVGPPFALALILMLRRRAPRLAQAASAIGTLASIGAIALIAQWIPEPYASRYLMVALFAVFTIGSFHAFPWRLTLLVAPLAAAEFALIASGALSPEPRNEIELVAFCALMVLVSLRLRKDRDRLVTTIERLRRTGQDRSKELARLNAELAALSSTDPLTGLPNRRRLDETLERLESPLAPVAVTVLMIDVDHFKLYNDCAGHAAGDACLRRIAGALSAALRSGDDIVARYGGEEFVAVICEASPEESLAIAERMRQAVAAMAIPHPGFPGAVVTVSIGVGMTAAGQGVMAALEQADRCLYAAKQSGRNRIRAVA